MKKLITGILILVGAIATGVAISFIPTGVRNNQIYQNKVVRKFDAKTYQGWVLAYAALNEAEVTMYNQAPVFDDPKEAEAYAQLNYPEKNLPDLINEFGILVQKPYAGQYSLNRQKTSLIDYFNKEITALNNAANSYITTNPKSPNAYDGSVLKALNSYSDTFGTLSRATTEMTLEKAQSTSLGDYYAEFLSDEEMSMPLAYSNIAKDYLLINIKRYQSKYTESIRQSTEGLDSATIRQVNILLPQIIE